MAKNLIIFCLLLACLALGGLVWLQSRSARPGVQATAAPALTPIGGDVRIVVPEAYLERVLRERLSRTSGTIEDPRFDVLPGSRAQLRARTTALGFEVPLQMDVRLSAVAGTVRADVTNVQAGPVTLPQRMQAAIQEQVDAALSQAISLEPTGFSITALATDDAAVTVGLTAR